MRLWFVVLSLIANAFFYKSALCFNLDEVFEEIHGEEKPEECKFTQNAKFRITNKTEGKSFEIDTSVQAQSSLEFLKIDVLKCCLSNFDKSYAFVKVYNTKLKKEVFSGWMFSERSSRNVFEDPKFDITLIRCM